MRQTTMKPRPANLTVIPSMIVKIVPLLISVEAQTQTRNTIKDQNLEVRLDIVPCIFGVVYYTAIVN